MTDQISTVDVTRGTDAARARIQARRLDQTDQALAGGSFADLLTSSVQNAGSGAPGAQGSAAEASPVSLLAEPIQPTPSAAILTAMPAFVKRAPAPPPAPLLPPVRVPMPAAAPQTTFSYPTFTSLPGKVPARTQPNAPAKPPGPTGATPSGYVDRGSANVPYDNLIVADARKYNVDPALVRAVIKAESGFDPRATSKVGAKGLMQLMDGTAKTLGVTDSYDPAQNISAGTRLLGELLAKYRGNVQLAVAAYNAGSGAVDKYDGIPPFPETQSYVKIVTGYMKQFAAKSEGKRNG